MSIFGCAVWVRALGWSRHESISLAQITALPVRAVATLRLRCCGPASAKLIAPCRRATNLCGYDPAPSADTASKAADIEYQCVTGGDDTWAKLDIADGVQPVGIPVRHV